MTDYKLTDLKQVSGSGLDQIVSWLQSSGLAIPVSQVVGLTQFLAKSDVYTAGLSTSSTSYVDLGHPKITQLPPGKYVFVYGMTVTNGPDNTGMELAINGTRDATSEQTVADSPNSLFTMFVSTQTLTLEQNTAGVQFRVIGTGGGTATLSKVFLFALKYA